MKSCKTCGKDTDELYKHHIIPIANGGKDKKENIIDICVDCHRIAHDLSFKSSKGPIRNGIKKTKDAHDYFCNLDDNFWLGFFDDLNLDKINNFNKNNNKNKTLFIIISKSGNTLETISNFLYLKIVPSISQK